MHGAEWWSVIDLIPILNRLTKTTNAQGGMVQFSYDANGNRLTHTDQNNHTTNYSYDAMNRMATRTDALTHGESYGYEPGGGLNKLTDRKGQVTGLTYDSLGRVTIAATAPHPLNPATQGFSSDAPRG